MIRIRSTSYTLLVLTLLTSKYLIVGEPFPSNLEFLNVAVLQIQDVKMADLKRRYSCVTVSARHVMLLRPHDWFTRRSACKKTWSAGQGSTDNSDA